ncbi:MAG: glutaredoxin [Solirubrobacterales bacterium]|nr:glutaredoxin [Solirubrobacterales bacterium]
MKDIVVYTTVACSFCTRVKALLDTREIPYREIDLARDPDGRVALAQHTGMMSFPQVIIDGELLGGFRETLAADQSGRLRELLAA